MSSGMRKVVFFLALVGIAYGAWAYMIKPANQALAAQKAEVQKKLQKLQELEKAKAAAKDLDQQLRQLEDAVAFLESKLPHESEIHQVLREVTEIVHRNSLKPKTIKTLKPVASNGYIEQPLKMELDGSFTSYYSFLLELERMERLTRICELSLTKDRDRDGNISASFTVSIFFQNKAG